jgi:hypothetical protein
MQMASAESAIQCRLSDVTLAQYGTIDMEPEVNRAFSAILWPDRELWAMPKAKADIAPLAPSTYSPCVAARVSPGESLRPA